MLYTTSSDIFYLLAAWTIKINHLNTSLIFIFTKWPDLANGNCCEGGIGFAMYPYAPPLNCLFETGRKFYDP